MNSLLLLSALACHHKADDTGQLDDTGQAAAASCTTTLRYTPATADLDGVSVAGSFNGWDSSADPMRAVGDGSYELTLDLPAGAYPYKFVEQADWSYGGYEGWVCDPQAEYIQCDQGYVDPSDTSWAFTCPPSTETGCNSMLVVPDCSAPTVSLTSLHIDRGGLAVQVQAVATAGADGGALTGLALLDGAEVAGAFDGTRFTIDTGGLSPSRHTLRLQVTGADGQTDEAWVPFWLDAEDGDAGWRRGSIYFAFVDRLVDGDTSNDATEGATDASGGANEIGDYMGGDLRGVIDLLPYLDDLGVGTIWLSNPQENAEGAWAGDCEATYAGYHAYWPDEPREVESHIGDAEALRALVEQAHGRGMRVIMDWVGNHVHQDHPYYADHPDWFNDFESCKDEVGGQLNFDRIPETCWFAPYLPDIDYAQPDALQTMVDDAMWWAQTYDLDGFRVDAVKHMSHAVPWDLEARVRAEIEHRDVGGDEQFWTVGETFDGYDRIAAYLSDTDDQGDETLQLDGQFDFPLYYAILGAFATEEGSLGDLESAVSSAEGAYGDALMSNFLGNHDVERFTTYAAEGYVGSCWGDTDLAQASQTADDGVYARMALAWTFLFTQPAPPLIYYGDEIGLAGYPDPDNRQPLWWTTGDLSGVTTVDEVASRVEAGPSRVVQHVAALGRARQEHPAFWRGTTVQWWREPDEWPTVWAYARTDSQSGDAVLVIINRSWDDRTLTNGLGFAGLSGEASYVDVLTGDHFTASGDSVSVAVPAYSSRVLVVDD